MTATVFVNGVTLTDDDWFNDLNRLHYTLLGDPATSTAVFNAITAHGADVASASTVNLETATGDLVDLTGNTAVSTIVLNEGHERTVRFTSTITLSTNALLVLPGSSNLSTVAGDFGMFRGYAAGVVRLTSFMKASGAPIRMSQITASLGADVALNNTGTSFDGPSVAQGTAGIWFVSGKVTIQDTAGIAAVDCKLWDGTTIIDSARVQFSGPTVPLTCTLSGFISSPAGNLRISCKDVTSTSGQILFNVTGNSKDSTITAIRIG